MTMNLMLFSAEIAAATCVVLQLYRFFWMRFRDPVVTPTGFGVFFGFLLLVVALKLQEIKTFIPEFFLISIATLLYWVDDFIGLRASVRMIISLVTGFLLSASVYVNEVSMYPCAYLVIAFFLFGLSNMIITNIVNFYDGADLNLATFIALTAGIILVFMPEQKVLVPIAMACVGFIIPFSVVNSRPRTLYLGDSGSFAFASLLVFFLILYIKSGDVAPQIAIPLMLPSVDTFFVFIVRVLEGHDLLTRNHMHLYQRLHIYYRGFGYLLPQIINVLIVLLLTYYLKIFFLIPVDMAVITAGLVTIPFYFFCRKFFLPLDNHAI